MQSGEAGTFKTLSNIVVTMLPKIVQVCNLEDSPARPVSDFSDEFTTNLCYRPDEKFSELQTVGAKLYVTKLSFIFFERFVISRIIHPDHVINFQQMYKYKTHVALVEVGILYRSVGYKFLLRAANSTQLNRLFVLIDSSLKFSRRSLEIFIVLLFRFEPIVHNIYATDCCYFKEFV